MKTAKDQASDEALVAARFSFIARNMPGLYFTLVIFVGFLTYFLRALETPEFLFMWAGVLIVGSAIRTHHWWRLGKRAHQLTANNMRQELAQTSYIGIFVCIAFLSITFVTMRAPNLLLQAMTMMLIWGAAVGTAFYLAVLPRTACSVILVATFATSFAFMRSGENILIVSVPALLALTAAILDLLRRTFDNFKALNVSHAEIALMRQEALDMSLTDALTNLPNRRLFDQKLRECATKAQRFAVAMIDLDGFKPINDIYGHRAGDRFLVEAARRFKLSIHTDGMVARVGGDEFALLIEKIESADEAVAIAQRLIDALALPFAYENAAANMSASCGIALHYKPEDAERLLERADIALYEAKGKARGGIVVFCEGHEQLVRQRTIAEQGLRSAIEKDEFEIHYQPIIDLRSGELSGFEALARWRHSELGPVSPVLFIPLAEQAGLIEPLTNSLLRKALRTASRWPAHLTLSFNLSAAQVDRPGTGLGILSALAACGLTPSRLEIEVTETAIVSDIETAKRSISALKAAGIRISIDDFGAGYSYFSQLCDLEFDKLKIDKSFVDRIAKERRAANVVEAIVRMCEGLNLECVAEGIETNEQMEILRGVGCHKGQGYLISQPLPERDVRDFIAACGVRYSRAS